MEIAFTSCKTLHMRLSTTLSCQTAKLLLCRRGMKPLVLRLLQFQREAALCAPAWALTSWAPPWPGDQGGPPICIPAPAGGRSWGGGSLECTEHIKDKLPEDTFCLLICVATVSTKEESIDANILQRHPNAAGEKDSLRISPGDPV